MMNAKLLGYVAGALMPMCASGAIAFEGEQITLEVAAEQSSLYWYTDYQKPYFEEILPKVSAGTIKANAVPYNQLGLTGFELMNLLKKGRIDMAAGTISYITQDSPAVGGGSLGGITKDLGAFKKIYDAYRPVLDREMSEKYNAKLLVVYAWPQSQIYCNFPGKTDVTFADLKGKKVRSYSASVSDLFEGLDMVPVTLPFAEVTTALQRGTVECMSSSLAGVWSSKLYEVLTHRFDINVSYSASFIAINLDTWNNFSPDQQEALSSSITDLQSRMWDKTASLEDEVIACLSEGPCPDDQPAGLITVAPTKADLQRLQNSVSDFVLKRFANRCETAECVDDWNATVGRAIGMSASK